MEKRCILSAVLLVPEAGKSEKQGQNAIFHRVEAVLAEQHIAGRDWSLRRLAAAHIAEAVAFHCDDRQEVEVDTAASRTDFVDVDRM